MMIESATTLVLALVVVLGIAMALILPRWRQAIGGSHSLPVWRFLQLKRVDATGPAALEAEVRCSLCASQQACRKLLAEGATSPVSDCPNLRLFQQRADPAAPRP
jgi:hypothetical protein